MLRLANKVYPFLGLEKKYESAAIGPGCCVVSWIRGEVEISTVGRHLLASVQTILGP
jgi:hypothetical protein